MADDNGPYHDVDLQRDHRLAWGYEMMEIVSGWAKI
jgi:hypothetical protein